MFAVKLTSGFELLCGSHMGFQGLSCLSSCMFSLSSIFMIIVILLSLKALQWDVGCNAFTDISKIM